MEPTPLDALPPPQMALKAEEVGVRKSQLRWDATLVLGVLGGAFIGLGAVFATVVSAGAGALPFGVGRLLAGLVFSLGLTLVVVGGAELFTGNNLLVMAWVSGRIRPGALARNWALVYAGNFLGAAGTALLVFLGGHHLLGKGAVGAAALAIAHGKLERTFLETVALAVLGNALVCLAVWLSYSARSTSDRVLAVVGPVTAFVACGFEHCVANMYFFASALLIEGGGGDHLAAGGLTVGTAVTRSLVPSTLGNVLGGVGLVGLVYWFVYLRGRAPKDEGAGPPTGRGGPTPARAPHPPSDRPE